LLSGGNPSGGNYSGPGVIGTNFNAGAAGIGTHTITYAYTDGLGCSATATATIDVVHPATVTLKIHSLLAVEIRQAGLSQAMG